MYAYSKKSEVEQELEASTSKLLNADSMENELYSYSIKLALHNLKMAAEVLEDIKREKAATAVTELIEKVAKTLEK